MPFIRLGLLKDEFRKRSLMGRRVNVDGPGDDPNEYWFECDDCEGTGQVNFPVGMDENFTEPGECPGCGGLGFYQGDASDV